MEDSSTYYVDKMIKLDMENSAAIIAVAQEIMDAGQLWVTLDGESFYIPELIDELYTLIEYEGKR